MALCSIPTDDVLHTTTPHGTPDHPFVAYLNELQQYAGNRMEWHWHGELELMLVVSGDVLCRCGSERLMLHAGDGLFVNKGIMHRYESTGDCTLSCFLFSPEFIAPADSAIYREHVLPVLNSGIVQIAMRREDGRHAGSLRMLERLRESAFSDDSMHLLRTRNLVASLWELLSVRVHAGTYEALPRQNERENTRLLIMAEYISAHYGESISLSDIASSANISPSEALRCFHVGMQTTPVRYLNEYRLSRAKERLLTTNDSVTSIAAVSGFESAGYFCRVFKAGVGCTPAEYRKRSRK